MDIKTLIGHGDHLFSKRGTLLSLWQEIADQFYVERADFTVSRSLGTDFAAHLTTSYPMMMRRDLGNSFSAMLRPTGLQWFYMRGDNEGTADADQEALEWLESKSEVMRRAMYDRRSLFTRATKEGDHDFAAFGQCALSVEMNRHADGLLYRCWHLRDVAWCEDAEGKVSTVHRKWKPTARDLASIFPGKIHPKVAELLSGSNPKPYHEVNVRHIVMPSEDYGEEIRAPFVSLFIDVDNQHIMEKVGQTYNMYVIPRWQTVSGSQYAFSPAAVAALPDGRLIQAMTRTLLEAGEKSVNPPMIGVQEAIRSDVSIYAGGITWADAAYDERLGEVLRPISQDRAGFPTGLNMREDIMNVLREAWYLNTLTMPQSGPEMTAYEVAQRVQEYIRQASPIFEPMESDYNGQICEVTFDLLLRGGAFGPMDQVPQSLRGTDIGFRFESPLHDAIERQKTQRFTEVKSIVADTLALDQSVVADIDVRTAFRDAIKSTGAPAAWLRSTDDADAITEGQREQQEAEQLIQQISAGAEAATKVGEAGQALGAEAMAA